MHYTIDQCEDIVDRAIASELAALQARLDAAHAREDKLADALALLKADMIEVMFPLINKHSPNEGWLPEQMQHAKAVEMTDAALIRHAAAKEQRNK